MRQQLAKWNPARSAWETDEQSVCGHSVVYSETFPSSGITLRGRAYALPTWEPPTGGSVSSSWLGPKWKPEPLEMTPDDAWMAGLFEGEGYLTVRRDQKKPRLVLGLDSTDADVIERLAAIAGVGKVNGPYEQRGIGTKPVHKWRTWAADDVESLLNRMWLGLGARRREKAVAAMTELRFPPTSSPGLLLSTPQARDYKGRPADGFNTACLVRDVEDLPR